MSMVEIENEHLFVEALNGGCNLFLGAGFSVHAHGNHGDLPTGAPFAEMLRNQFLDQRLPETGDLTTLSTILKATQKKKFREYCDDVFRVTGFDRKYLNLTDINIKNIFTTNIDNLVHLVFDNIYNKYLRDIFLLGPNADDSRTVNYFALHGSVNHPDREYVFGATEIASAFGDEPQLWNHFAEVLGTHPTIFWGYGMGDSGTLQAVRNATKSTKRGRANQPIWIVLRPGDIANDDYYRALGLSIIRSDTSGLLEKIGQFATKSRAPQAENINFSAAEFPEYQVPSIGQVPVRDSSVYFEGAEPTWFDILQGIPCRTQHFASVENSIASRKHVLLTGVPASGKSTILRSLACGVPDYRRKVVFVNGYMEEAKAKILASRLINSGSILFWDNIFHSVGAAKILEGVAGLQIVGADRDYNYEFGFNLLAVQNYVVHNCSDLTPLDAQRVIESIPGDLRLREPRRVAHGRHHEAIFDIISRNTKSPSINDRIRRIFSDLGSERGLYADLFVLISYFHYCRVPASFDVVSSYCGLEGISILDVREIIRNMGAIVKEYEDAFAFLDQDYFEIRSQLFAEACIYYAPPIILRRVLTRILTEISQIKIPQYDVFQRSAFRNEVFLRAFPEWEEGKRVYDYAYDVSKETRANPYIMQHCALYLAAKSKYREAFAAVDDAMRVSGGRIFTIRATQARIRFEANIDVKDQDGFVYQSLLESIQTMEECFTSDRSKYRHIDYYSNFALRLDDRYPSDESVAILGKAERWLEVEVTKPGAGRRLRRRLQKIKSRLGGDKSPFSEVLSD